MTNRIGHRDDAEAESERHSDQTNTDLREAGGDHRAATSRKSEPKRSDQFGSVLLGIHIAPPCSAFALKNAGNSPIGTAATPGSGLHREKLADFGGFSWPSLTENDRLRWTFPALSGTCP